MSETKATKAFQAWLKSSIDHAQNGNEPSRWAAWEAGASWANERAAKRIAELEAALEVFATLTSREMVEGPDPHKIARARAVLSQEKQHD